jgi:hypothetical protein
MDNLYWWVGAIVFWGIFPLALAVIWIVLAFIIFWQGRHAGRFLMYLIRRGYVRDDKKTMNQLAKDWDYEPDKAPWRLF